MVDYVGSVVRPTAGREKGTLCYVIGAEPPYLFLADGKRRRLGTPKRKKEGHVTLVFEKNAIEQGESLPASDRELRSRLARLRDQSRADQGGN